MVKVLYAFQLFSIYSKYNNNSNMIKGPTKQASKSKNIFTLDWNDYSDDGSEPDHSDSDE